nr:hypothetical protein [Corynebacterium stationis]
MNETELGELALWEVIGLGELTVEQTGENTEGHGGTFVGQQSVGSQMK